MNGAVPSTWVVHKFGGSSVASAECFQRVAEIVESQDSSKLAVVLSACKGVTDALLQLVSLAEHQDEEWRVQLHSVRGRHLHIGSALLPAAALSTYMAEYD